MALGKKSGWAGLGVIIRDHHGRLFAAKSLTWKGILEPVAAEALASRVAVQLVRELRIQNIYLEGDAKLIVDVVMSKEPDWSRKGYLIEDIRMELQYVVR